MKAWELTPGSGAGLQWVDRPTRPLQANEVRIRVRAVSLNYRDLIMASGKGGKQDLHGRIPASDGAGEIVEVSSQSRFKVGDRVAGCFFQTWQGGTFEMRHHDSALGGSVDGMLAEEVILNEAGVVRLPESLDFAEGACLPCAALTAWSALVTRGKLAAGQTVLALGTGGVAIFALQFARALGATVIITSSSDEKISRAKKLGARDGVNYRAHPDWDKEVWRLTEKRGVDHVVEVGGPGTFPKSLNSVSASGHIALIGVLTGFGAPEGGLFPLVSKNATVSGIYVGSRAGFEEMNQFIETHKLKPVIDRSFRLNETPAAYEYMRSGAHFGKIVIVVAR